MVDTDFNELSIHRVTETDFDDVKKFLLADFLYNEPLNRSVNLNAEDSDELFSDLTNRGIASSLSYVLRAPDGEIAALRLATILDRPEEEHQSQHGEVPINAASDNNNMTVTKAKVYCPRAQIIEDILMELESKIWFLINPRLNRLLLWSIISVHKNYTRRGFALKMLCYKLDEAIQMGCQGCIAEASSFKSQLLFKKIGYEKIYEVKHSNWLDDRGQQIFKCDDSTDSVQLFFKPLQ
ncbi:unnamed protein product [Cercopithifilaria johnstoni]|uniref:aralkylamine N-acetyltransferase n=1 Tax=Cercopithifilaria johnstoni TaxID=2874296 RepID=A0A8J2M2T8_9BILA|nr:unnamed protein product [Cercopithifilaria johnstoni]